ncbi:tryptophan synthase subunit alpha [Aureibacter tunicatorum]|uniref:Tryptophan synthase alpha chain n=1 Tax=Aureibacter tunicatorum TaxID=866807 RepID=A0AAE4BQJ6_9BACT|nr:tryptophan synthase subunit alpha [Aureibacter tunicatorum]MDR6239199.1 tryptophan synthase alpha chain [Aureibacter tunicatorum]BDD04875.1 tryptophan synthase alpha chain [Aureibacter tunicatorum]
MENRINELFKNKKEGILSVYFSAGYPSLNDTEGILEAIQKSGADFVEVGMPFSDPVADGPTIQHSSEVALENGMSTALLFNQLKDIRQKVDMPLLLMGYINPVIKYGIEEFCKKCQEVGIDGLILPDMPMQVYLEDYKEIFEKYGLLNIFLITPQTSDERIKYIDEHSEGFIYMVSSASVTGAKSNVSDQQLAYFERVNDLGLKNPRIIGFGISNKETFDKACSHASGAIIGSAFVNVLRENPSRLEEAIIDFVGSVKGTKN